MLETSSTAEAQGESELVELRELQKLVRQHQVCWTVCSENLIVGAGTAKRVQVGFELDLTGIHDHPAHPPSPGCDECLKVWHRLERLARWILPAESRKSRYELSRFTPVLSYSPQRKLREEVTLTIKVLHREGFDQPVDACETRCLREMEQKLKAVGARKDTWSV